MKTVRTMTMAAGMVALLAVTLGVAMPAAAVHGGAPPAKMVDLIWHDGELWNTVVLGGLHGNVPEHTLDAFYMVPGQNPVAGAGPGDSDYNGGRWLPTALVWTVAPYLLTDGDDVEAAIDSGDLVVDGTGDPFLCPLTNPNDSA